MEGCDFGGLLADAYGRREVLRIPSQALDEAALVEPNDARGLVVMLIDARESFPRMLQLLALSGRVDADLLVVEVGAAVPPEVDGLAETACEIGRAVVLVTSGR